jgi:hypothetical protein
MHGAEHLLDRAREFAHALDACDYRKAAEFLSPNWRYDLAPGDTRLGPDDILANYRQCDEKARREFEDVAYSSEVAATSSRSVTLLFCDKLRARGRTHTFRCSQIVYFGQDDCIERIELREIAGERDRLNEFRRLAGVPEPHAE